MGKNIVLGDARVLEWDPKDVKGSLTRLREYVEGEAQKASDWYLQRKQLKAAFSRSVRLGAIIATALGALFPIAAKIIPGLPDQLQSALVPALLVGLAAALLGADKAFGFSTGWIRYMTTASVIRRALEEFRLDWLLKMSQADQQPTSEQFAEFLQSAKAFRLTIDTHVLDETRAWAAEFQNSIAQLEKDARDKFEHQGSHAMNEAKAIAEAHRSGSLELSIPNGHDADDRTFTVQLDAPDILIKETLVGTTRWARIGLKPGAYRIAVSAKAAGKAINDAIVCDVQPGKMAKAELRLPIRPAA